MPTPPRRNRVRTPRLPKGPPKPQHHRMTADEYFAWRMVQNDEELEVQRRRLQQIILQDEAARIEGLRNLKPDHWITIHWLVPNGAGQRAETITGRVKDVNGKTLEFWVDSVPDETALHGISRGDIIEVPFEAVTSVSAPSAS